MAGYCTLYLCDRQAVLLREQRSRLTLAGIIGRGDDDRIAATALRSLLARFPNDRLTVVVDSVDEELLVEALPPLGTRDLGELVARRLEHRRERRLLSWAAPRRLAIPGWQRAEGARVPVRIGLLAGDGAIAPWLQAVLAAGARIDRIASPALLAAPVAARLGRGRNDGLLVTVGPAGIRQTLVTEGVARFTRLAQLFDGGADVGAILAECRRTLEYLLMNQLVRRDAIAGGRLRLWLVADGIGAGGALPPSLAVDSASSIALHAVNGADLGAPRVDRPLSGNVGGAVLWTDRRLAGALAGGYETAAARRPLLVARLQRAMVGGAAGLALASAAALATVELAAAWDDDQPARATNAWQQDAEQRLSAAVSRLPISGSEMRRLVTADRMLRDRRIDLDALLQPIAVAVQSSPTVRLERLGWARAAPQPEAPALPPAEITIESTIRLPATKREANDAAQRFATALAAGCGCPTVLSRPPYDPDAATAFSGHGQADPLVAAGGGGRAQDKATFVVRMQQPRVAGGGSRRAATDAG
jgi:hypothetical protein